MALAYATDLATGQSRDFALRSCVLAMRLAEAPGLDDRQRSNVYHEALLRYIGCNADTHLLASAIGDEIVFRQDLARIDLGDHSEVVETITRAIRRSLAVARGTGRGGRKGGSARPCTRASPFWPAIARSPNAAGRRLALPASDLRELRWSGFAHDIGELGTPVSTWLRAGPLTAREADAARLHPYHGERALASLGGEGRVVAALVLRHHERLDGSGYHRGVKGADLSPAARILAAAEAFVTATEARPHRAAVREAGAAARLRDAVREGKLCPEAVEAVLVSAGQRARRDATRRLAGLTPRETEVLRLIAAGHTAMEAARLLRIAPKTADNHIQSLYSKMAVSTRTGAALYALEHDLVH